MTSNLLDRRGNLLLSPPDITVHHFPLDMVNTPI